MTYHPLQCRLSHCVQTICHRIGNFLWKADIPTHQREKEREGRGEKRRKEGEEEEGGRRAGRGKKWRYGGRRERDGGRN